MKQTFVTVVQGSEGAPTGIEIPADVIAALGPSKKPAVVMSVAGYTYRSTVAVMGGRFMVALSKANREAAGVKAGQQVEVSIELDNEPRTVAIPDDLAAALAAKAGASAAFDALAFSKRKDFVRQVEEAKSPETRSRRIAGIVEKLAAS